MRRHARGGALEVAQESACGKKGRKCENAGRPLWRRRAVAGSAYAHARQCRERGSRAHSAARRARYTRRSAASASKVSGERSGSGSSRAKKRGVWRSRAARTNQEPRPPSAYAVHVGKITTTPSNGMAQPTHRTPSRSQLTTAVMSHVRRTASFSTLAGENKCSYSRHAKYGDAKDTPLLFQRRTTPRYKQISYGNVTAAKRREAPVRSEIAATQE